MKTSKTYSPVFCLHHDQYHESMNKETKKQATCLLIIYFITWKINNNNNNQVVANDEMRRSSEPLAIGRANNGGAFCPRFLLLKRPPLPPPPAAAVAIFWPLNMVTNDYVTIANGNMEDEFMRRHHKHDVKEHQCSSSLAKHIKAPVPLVNINSSLPLCFFLFFSFSFRLKLIFSYKRNIFVDPRAFKVDFIVRWVYVWF